MPSSTPPSNGKSYAAIYDFFGVDLKPSGTQHSSDCPFCAKEDHFFVNITNGLFDCKSCQKAGNIYNFLHQHYLDLATTTPTSQLKGLARARRLPSDAIKQAGFVFDSNNRRFLLPIYNRNSALASLRVYAGASSNRTLYNPPAPLISHLYNSQKLKGSEDTILLCEGEWDAIALEHLFTLFDKKTKARTKVTVIGVPGAGNVSVFTSRILEMLAGKKVIFLFDHDDSGKAGTQKISTVLSQTGITNLHTIKWPDSYPDKYDLSDHISRSTLTPEETWEQLSSWVEPLKSDVSSVLQSRVLGSPDLVLPHRTKFRQVLKDFRNHGVHISKDFEGGIAITAACGISNDLPGDPLWMFLVGASGTGKSLILDSVMQSKNYVYRTNTYYTDLASGYKGDDQDNTTLLYKLIGKTFVIKDYTTVLTQPPIDQQKMNGLLRDVYDGRLHLSWGNGKEISFEGFFSIVAGVTNKIHTQRASHLGERFLKYEIAPPQKLGSREAVLESLQGGLNSEQDMDNRKIREASFCSFVDQLREARQQSNCNPVFSHPQLSTIAALAQFVAVCRSVVERDKAGAVLYDPSPESGTRLAKQLSKLPQALCAVYGVRNPNEEILNIVRKTAWDTSYSRVRTVYEAIYHNTSDSRTDGMGLMDLVDELQMPKTTIRRTLDDLRALSVVKRRTSSTVVRGRPELLYRLSPEARNLYYECGFTHV